MTDKLNNLVIADIPEVGGYYRAGDCEVWDEELTLGQLYLIKRVRDNNCGGGDENDCILTVVDGEGKELEEVWMAMSPVVTGYTNRSHGSTIPGTFYKNPAKV